MSAVFSKDGVRGLRISWVLLALAVVSAAAVAFGSYWFLQQEKRDGLTLAKRLQQSKARNDAVKREIEDMRASSKVFQDLLDRGILQEGSRLDFIERLDQLKNSHRLTEPRLRHRSPASPQARGRARLQCRGRDGQPREAPAQGPARRRCPRLPRGYVDAAARLQRDEPLPSAAHRARHDRRVHAPGRGQLHDGVDLSQGQGGSRMRTRLALFLFAFSAARTRAASRHALPYAPGARDARPPAPRRERGIDRPGGRGKAPAGDHGIREAKRRQEHGVPRQAALSRRATAGSRDGSIRGSSSATSPFPRRPFPRTRRANRRKPRKSPRPSPRARRRSEADASADRRPTRRERRGLHADRDRGRHRRTRAAPRDDRGCRRRPGRAAAPRGDAPAACGSRDRHRPLRLAEQAAALPRGWKDCGNAAPAPASRNGARAASCQWSAARPNSQTHGVVPWRSLGLAEPDVTDGWGNRLTYRVAPELVADNAMDLDGLRPGRQPDRGTHCWQCVQSDALQLGDLSRLVHATLHLLPPPKDSRSATSRSATLIMDPAASPIHGRRLRGHKPRGESRRAPTATKACSRAVRRPRERWRRRTTPRTWRSSTSTSPATAAVRRRFPLFRGGRRPLRRLAAAPLHPHGGHEGAARAACPLGARRCAPARPQRGLAAAAILIIVILALLARGAGPRRVPGRGAGPRPARRHRSEPEAGVGCPRTVRLAEPGACLARPRARPTPAPRTRQVRSTPATRPTGSSLGPRSRSGAPWRSMAGDGRSPIACSREPVASRSSTARAW